MKISILMVEDNSDHALLARISLERTSQMEVTVVQMPDECHAILREKKFDIILLDYNLPSQNGLSVLKRIKKENLTDAPIVLVTGHGHEKVAVEAMKAGAFDYVVKSPDYPGILPNVVKRVLSKYKIYQDKKKMEAEIVLRNKELQVLNSISEVLNQSLILEEILLGAIQRISDNLYLDTVGIYLRDGRKQTLTLKTGLGALDQVQEFQRIELEGRGVKNMLIGKGPLVTDCLVDEANSFARALAGQGMQSLISVPLTYKSRFLGVCLAGSQDKDYFAERRVNLLASIANQISIAIENAKLYSQTDKLKNNLENVFNSSLDMIVTLSESGKITFHNEKFANVYVQGKDVIGRDFLELVPESLRDFFSTKLRELQCGKTSLYETEMLHKDNTPMPCLISQSTLRGRGEFLLVIKDISEIARLQEQLLQSEKLSALGQMIAGAAHELNNPLAGILGYSQLLLEEKLPGNVRGDLEVILKEAMRCQNIVRNLLTFARKQNSKRQQVDVNDTLNRVIALHSSQLKGSEVEVTRKFAEGTIQVFADEHQLQQVFSHLVENAFDALRISRKKHKRLTVTTTKLDDVIRIEVADNGIGIPNEDRSKIFDPFYTGKEVGEGIGLGLSMCFGIVQSHQGTIHFESELGEGSTFVVALPVIQGEPDTSTFEVRNLRPATAATDA